LRGSLHGFGIIDLQHAAAGGHRHAVLAGKIARLGLVSHRIDPARARTDETCSGGGNALGKLCVFGEEAVARMQRIAAGTLENLDDGVLIEIALACGCGAYEVSFARHFEIGRVSVRFGVHRHGVRAQLVEGTHHAGCNSTSIGDQYLVEHHCFLCSEPGDRSRFRSWFDIAAKSGVSGACLRFRPVSRDCAQYDVGQARISCWPTPFVMRSL
jgi:hypothetical protein